MDKVNFSQPLLHLDIIGLNPLKNDRFTRFRRIFTITIFICSNVLSFSELFRRFDNYNVIVRGSEVIFPFYHNDWKLAILFIYRKKLSTLIKKSNKFWSFDEFGELYKNKMSINHKYAQRFFYLYQILLTFSASQYVLLTIGSNKPMILTYGETEGFSSKTLNCLLVWHTLYIFIIYNIINGFDGLFFYLIAHVLTELKMVKVAFSGLKIKPRWSYKERFRKSTQHHKFILDYISSVNSLYSMFLMHQHISCLFGICFGLYLFRSNGFPPDYEHISKYIPYVASYVLNVWVFCFAGQLIIDWSVNISDEIFYDDWALNRAYKNKNDKLIVIQRAQYPAKLSLAGFGDLNLESFNLVLKNALSFFTFMNAMLEK